VATLIALVLIGLVAGIGITAVGPGGVLVTVGLFVLTDLSPEAVAGTAIVTHIATGALGTLAYWRSGQLRRPSTLRAAALLAAVALVGTPIGVLVNGAVSGRGFGVLLAAVVAVTGILVGVRERRVGSASRQPSRAVVAAVGLAVAVAAGMFGIGGPMLSVPLLVVIGMPVLDALGAAQAQSILIASVGTVGYAAQGAIDWPLALAVGLPELAGVLIGWRVAHAVPTHRLRLALAVALVCLAPYLALHA
jgi:uncharacterized membrane protein YfcA